jgi:hypothetical protein
MRTHVSASDSGIAVALYRYTVLRRDNLPGLITPLLRAFACMHLATTIAGGQQQQ